MLTFLFMGYELLDDTMQSCLRVGWIHELGCIGTGIQELMFFSCMFIQAGRIFFLNNILGWHTA